MASRKPKRTPTPEIPVDRFRLFPDAARVVAPQPEKPWNVWDTPAETQAALYHSDPLRPRPDTIAPFIVGVNPSNTFSNDGDTFSDTTLLWSNV